MREVLGGTKVLGVLGWPVAHSFSPPMQNAALAALGLADPVPEPSVDPFREPVYADGQPWPDQDED